MIKANKKIFTILYRLTLPGSLLLVFSALLIRVGVLADPETPLAKFFPVVVFGIGLAVSAFFRRSRLFFALLVMALAQSTFAWVMPSVSVDSAGIVANAVAILLPLNLLAWPGLPDGATLEKAGVRRLSAGSGIGKAVLSETLRLAKDFLAHGASEPLVQGPLTNPEINAMLRKD